MNWLDSNYPPEAGLPETVEKAHPDAYVVYSNIKVGAINSTFTAA